VRVTQDIGRLPDWRTSRQSLHTTPTRFHNLEDADLEEVGSPGRTSGAHHRPGDSHAADRACTWLHRRVQEG
jgi:hypothetical protein